MRKPRPLCPGFSLFLELFFTPEFLPASNIAGVAIFGPKGWIMTDISVDAMPSESSQFKRLAQAFSAPGMLFASVAKGNTSWWLPFVLVSLCSYLLFTAVSYKVGIGQAIENQIRLNPSASERLSHLPADQLEAAKASIVKTTNISFLATPIIVLLSGLGISVTLLGTAKFLFGGKASFAQMMAVWAFSSLVTSVKMLLGILVLFAGADPEVFNLKNFAPTNPAAFLSPLECPPTLYAFLASLDFVSIWSMVVMSIGVTTVAKLKPKQGYMIVFGWWILFVAVTVVAAAF